MQSLQEELHKKSLEQAKLEAKAEMESLMKEKDEKLLNVQVYKLHHDAMMFQHAWENGMFRYSLSLHTSNHCIRSTMLDCWQKKKFAKKVMKMLPNKQKGS